MDENSRKTRKFSLPTRLALVFFALMIGLAMVLVSLCLYLVNPHAAGQISRLLSERLHQNCTISRIEVSGATLHLKGIALANPENFPAGNMAAADTISITPQWGALFSGKPALSLLVLDNLRVDLQKNAAGIWNYQELQRTLAGPERSGTAHKGTPFIIRQLTLNNASVSIDGRSVSGISLQVFNLSGAGVENSRLQLSLEDGEHSRYTISGTFQGGREPACDLEMTAPHLSVKGVAGLLRLKQASAIAGGTGSLKLQVTLKQGLIQTRGTLDFHSTTLVQAQQALPLSGRLSLSGNYHLTDQTLRLETLSLDLKHILQFHLTGSVRLVRTKKEFSATATVKEAHLGKLAIFIPQLGRSGLNLTGNLTSTPLQISGNAHQGITAIHGNLRLDDIVLTRNETVLVEGLHSAIELSSENNGLVARGRLTVQGQETNLLQALDARFISRFSSLMQPLSVHLTDCSARLAQVPISGRVSFNPSAEDPLDMSLLIPSTTLAPFNRFLEKQGLHLESGQISGSAAASGNLGNLHGQVRLQLDSVQGTRDRRPIRLDTGSVTAQVSAMGEHLATDGSIRLAGLVLDGTRGDGEIAYHYQEGLIVLSNGRFRSGDLSLALERLSGRVPKSSREGETARIPLALGLTGASATRGPFSLNGISGTLQADYSANATERWLDGTLDLTVGQAAWQGASIGAPTIRCTFARSGTRAIINSALLGGAIKGEIAFYTFTPTQGPSFDMAIRQANLAEMARILPKSMKILPQNGMLNGTWSGSYRTGTGLDSRFQLQGKDIAMGDREGRTLISRAGLDLSGGTAGNWLTIDQGRLSAGDAVTVDTSGILTNPLSDQRQGSLSFTMKKIALNDALDPVINSMPRFMQEATFSGTVAAEGNIDMQSGSQVLNGTLHLEKVALAANAQKMVIDGVEGSLPFSLALGGTAKNRVSDFHAYSKSSYDQALTDLRQHESTGNLRIGRLAVGAVEFKDTALAVTAADGFNRLDSLTAHLYGGAILGRGFLNLNKGLNYRSDLLVNGLSLKQLCAGFPGIDGYLSGVVDGVIGISGTGSDLTSLTGFMHMWAREEGTERMLISREFLQRLSGQKLSGFFFRNDRSYDRAEIVANLAGKYLSFDALDISHTNLIGVKDLSVSIAPTQNRIALDHLFTTIQEAAGRGKAAAVGTVSAPDSPQTPQPETEFKWQE